MKTKPDDSVNSYKRDVVNSNNHLMYEETTKGLTKREYFAAIALQGILANPKTERMLHEDITKTAVCVAGDLIQELNRYEN